MNNYELFIDGYRLPQPLIKDELDKLIKEACSGSKEARDKLIIHNIRLVLHEVTNRFRNIDYDKKDLVSIGSIGLVKAVNTYDITKEVKFATYAVRCIDNEILMYFRATKKLNAEVFLEEPIGKDKDDNVVTLQEVLENDERSVEDSVDLKFKVKLLYEKMKSILKDRERTILELRFGLNGDKPKTQIEISKSLGISRSYVSRIETKAINKLSNEFKE